MMARWGTVTEFWRVFREINPEAIRQEAERPLRIVLAGLAGSGKTTLGHALAGDPDAWVLARHIMAEIDASSDQLRDQGDLYVYVCDATRGITDVDRATVDRLRHAGQAFVLLVNKCDLVDNLHALKYECYASLGDVPANRIVFGSARHGAGMDELARALLAAAPELRLALARRLAPLRSIVSDELIAETSRVNAEFALLSNLPANIPLVGGILGGGADFLVLTKNQAMLIFKLAAIHGRDLRSKAALVAELTPVIGLAFVWRTVAREIIGMLPTIVAAAPKTAIGYIGTFVTGKTAQYYYAYGHRPSKQAVQRFSEEAAHRLRLIRSRLPLPGGHRAAEDADDC